MYMLGIHKDPTNTTHTGGRVLCNYANDRALAGAQDTAAGVDVLFRRGTALMQTISPATYDLFSAFKEKLREHVHQENQHLAAQADDATRASEPSFADTLNVLNNSGVAGNYTNCVHSDPDYASFCYVFRMHTPEYDRATPPTLR